MESTELEAFLEKVDPDYKEYAKLLQKASFSKVKEIAAATPVILKEATEGDVPIGPACAIVAAAQKATGAAAGAAGGAAGAAESADVLKQLAVGQEKVLQALEKIQHLQLQATSATRHASSITIDDLSMVESALKVTWVRRDEDGSSEVEARLADATEFKWEENIPEPSQKEEYMTLLRDQVVLPPHLVWSERVDKNDILRTPRGAGGADLPFSIGCRTDALVVLLNAKVDTQGAIAATVELKKKVVQQSVRQAKTTFYCAALLSQMPVLSVLTDMQIVFTAFYTDGEQDSSTKSTLCIQHTFSSLRSLTNFMHTALESVPKKALMWDEITNKFVQCPEVANPVRVRLPVPRHSSQRMWKAAMAVLAEHAAGGSDVGRLVDLAAFSDQDPDAEGPIHYSYFS